MSEIEKIECRACGHSVDSQARICPYCAANPHTGEAERSRPPIEKLIPPKPQLSFFERASTTIRSRSGSFLAASIILGVTLLIIVSTVVNERQRAVADVPPVPLTEVTDLRATRERDSQELELPELNFQFDGNPASMENFILEEDAVAPPKEPEEGTDANAE
ncbi:MAG: zinc ribbon domain-containing protein [Acidobacteria bacterium]|nr:zinc ribbon domain-containing protein [Acidobacteriota bacterium]